MLFQQSIVGNSQAARGQWQDVLDGRYRSNLQEQNFASLGQVGQINPVNADGTPMVAANGGQRIMVAEGLIPQDVYQEFDNVTVQRFRSDDGDTFLNDLLPMSRSVNIGKLVHKFRKGSDAGASQTSMTGQIGVKMDQVEYKFDGSLIPIHDTGFGRNWREWNAQRSEGFDALIDDQRESVAELRRRLADNFLDGHKDKSGNFIALDSISWQGMKNDSRVAAIDLGAGGINFDFTDQSQTFTAIENAFKEIRDIMWITNNCGKDLTVYVSRTIASNFERESSENFASRKILERLAGLQGIAAIKASSKLVGNELMGFPLDSSAVRPIVGMGLNTVAMPRPVYNSNYDFVVWAAVGFEVRTDFTDQTCAFFAQDLT